MSVIIPEEGRHVHFVPHQNDQGGRFDAGKPHAAVVVHAWHERLVNLTVFDRNGVPVPRTSVELVQPHDPIPTGRDYCRWMPYQVKTAEKQA